MKKIILLIFLIIQANFVYSQVTKKLIKDFDGDNKNDTIYIDSVKDRLVCLLSTNNYIKKISNKIRILNAANTLIETKNGFKFWNHYSRSEYFNEFKYNSQLKKMQLIKMIRKEYNGSTIGKSKINLLTNQYIGYFRYAENYKYGVENKYDSLDIIKTKIIFPQTFIETFSDSINYEYEKKCVNLLNEAVENRK